MEWSTDSPSRRILERDTFGFAYGATLFRRALRHGIPNTTFTGGAAYF